jgi:endo-1,4-beta-xylanase
MKWAPLRPTPTTYDFKEADALVGFAQEHGMAIRGHNLCWHEQLPNWFAQTATKENARAVLTDHISTVAGRYKGKIQSWDVVNEAIWIKDGRPDGMRSSSPWFELLGPEYVEIAFRAARAADPNAKLTYNDYGIEYDTEEDMAKRAAVLGLVKRLKEGGVPIDAVGIQSHLKGTNAVRLGEGIADFSDAMRKMKLEVYLTELDVDDDSLPQEPVSQQDLDVADVYKRYLTAMLKGPAVKAVLTWGLANEQSWLQAEKRRVKHPERKERPLLFTGAEGGGGPYVATPAFYAVRAAIDAAKKR